MSHEDLLVETHVATVHRFTFAASDGVRITIEIPGAVGSPADTSLPALLPEIEDMFIAALRHVSHDCDGTCGGLQ